MAKNKSQFSYSDPLLTTYLKEIGKYKFLSPEELNDLVVEAQRGNVRARNKIVESNLRFVVSIAKQFQNRGIPLMDLIDTGNEGLIYSINKFDPTLGVPFLSYSVYWIRQYIYQLIYWSGEEIRLPISKRIQVIKLIKASKMYYQEHSAFPSSEELSGMTSIPVEDVEYLSQFSKKPISIDDFVGGDEENFQVGDVIADPDLLDNKINHTFAQEELLKMFEVLTKREHDVVMLLFGIGVRQTDQEIVAKMFGVGTERIRQIKESALKKLKHRFGKRLRNLI